MFNLREIRWKVTPHVEITLEPDRSLLVPLHRFNQVHVPVESNPTAAAFDGTHLWVTNSGSDSVSKIDITTNKVVATQQKSMFDAQQEAESRRREMEKTKAQADLQPSLVKAEIDVQIASQQKQSAIIHAEGKSQATRLEQEGIAAGISAVGKAEGEKILAIGQATAEAYNRQSAAVGQGPLAMIEVMKRVSDGKIKITPDIMVSGGGNGNGDGASSNMLAAFMASLMGSGMRIAPPENGKQKG